MSLRYAKQGNMTKKYDFLIIGGGVAGMSFALKVARAEKYRIALCCKTTLEEANTAKAQGGIASVTNLLVDDFEKHIHDTMVAGDWLSDPAAVEQVVRNAPKGIEELVNWGVNFVSSTMPMIPAQRSNADSWKPCGTTPISMCWRTILPSRSSPNTI